MPNAESIRKKITARLAVLDAEAVKLRTTLAVLDDLAQQSATRRLPATLRAATALRPPATRGSQTAAILDLLRKNGSLSKAELRRHVPGLTSLSSLMKRGIIVKGGGTGRGEARYRLSTGPTGKRRAARTKGSAPTLRRADLSAFLVRTVQDTPRAVAGLLEALRADGHDAPDGRVITGPLGSLTKRGLLKRMTDGTYHVRPKGAKFLASLATSTENGATA
jgi:hypothetical protein